MIHITDNHDAFLDYLYEEGDPAERLMMAKHLQECAACAVAVFEFQNVRGMLSDWAPPAPQLGFRIVRDSSPSATVTSPSASPDHRARGGWSWRWGWGPATTKEGWRGGSPAMAKGLLQAAAAILLFISGMAVSQLHVDYREGALTVRTRWAAPAMPASGIRNASITLPPQGPSSPIDIDEIERAIRKRLAAQNTSSVDTETLLQRVRAMIDQSEQRQQRELALRLSQVSREVETQHQADLLRIQQDFGQQQEATLDYLVKTSGGVK
jgi:anti-sigma factor RsiW